MPHTPTCNAVQPIVKNLSGTSTGECWTTDPCEGFQCVTEMGDIGFQLKFLKCNKPRAVQVVVNVSFTVVWFNHTFTTSDSVILISPEGDKIPINVTLKETKDGIGLEVGLKLCYVQTGT